MTCRRDNRYVPGMRNFPFVRRFLRGDAATTSTAAPAPTRESERERNHPFQPLLLTPSLIVQNSICPFATLISRSRGQDFEQDWRILENIRSERGGGFFSSGGSKNMGCTSVRGEKRWMRGEDPLWNVR